MYFASTEEPEHVTQAEGQGQVPANEGPMTAGKPTRGWRVNYRHKTCESVGGCGGHNNYPPPSSCQISYQIATWLSSDGEQEVHSGPQNKRDEYDSFIYLGEKRGLQILEKIVQGIGDTVKLRPVTDRHETAPRAEAHADAEALPHDVTLTVVLHPCGVVVVGAGGWGGIDIA